MDSNQEQDMTTIEWPSLPYLKELNLNVSSFDFFSKVRSTCDVYLTFLNAFYPRSALKAP